MNRQPTHESIESVDSSDEYETDSDYEDIQIQSWGENAQSEPATWDSLIDESIKTKAGGIGSGNLHRRGGNFKPLSDEHILAMRLKKPIPGSGASQSKKKKPKKKKVPTVNAISSTRTRINRPYVPLSIKTAPVNQRAPPSQSVWSTTNLSSEPFWENQKKTTPVPERPIAQPNTKNTRGAVQSAWASFEATENQSLNTQKPSNSMYTPSLSSPSSKYATPISSLPQTNQSTPIFKPVAITSESPLIVPFNSTETPRPKSHVHLDKSLVHKHLSAGSKKSSPQPQSQKQQSPKQQAQQSQQVPFMQITVNIAHGISTIISLYKDSDPEKIAEEFGPKHDLIVTESAKKGIANTLRRVLDAHLQQAQDSPIL
ncbi:hypothetical protein BD560DRAFT_162 [Blakeslea trispora]|nr:hypothetical protein BD560DRAFT_162 [Blakeslea trispora]